MKEDKAAITKKLEELLNMTRMGKVELEYKEHGKVYSEEVIIRGFDGDDKVIYVGAANVSCDSGVALIRDIMKQDCFN